MYPDMTPIIPLDFICHCYNVFECEFEHGGHLGQVVFFGRDKKIRFLTQDQALL